MRHLAWLKFELKRYGMPMSPVVALNEMACAARDGDMAACRQAARPISLDGDHARLRYSLGTALLPAGRWRRSVVLIIREIVWAKNCVQLLEFLRQRWIDKQLGDVGVGLQA